MRYAASFLLAIAAGALAASVSAQETARKNLLLDGFIISGIDGKLVQSDAQWQFVLESPVSDGKAELAAGQSLQLLPSATLQQLAADSKKRVDAHYRLWGKVTRYADRNYVLPVYFLPLTKQPDSEQAAPQPVTTINAPGDILTIPPSVASRLQTAPALVTAPAEKPLDLKADSVFADRTGIIVREQPGRFVLRLDGAGREVGTAAFELLPCQALELAWREQSHEQGAIRFSVAGIVTKYDGRDYLLLQRATRAYTHGNFNK